MDRLLVTLHNILPDVAAGAAPDWLHLVPAGTFATKDGRGPYKLTDPASVITASMKAGKLPIDENHAIDHALKTGQASPARGWIVEMQNRADGLWGRVEWTPPGLQLMADRAYRGFSPAFTAPGGVVTQVVRGSLTNTPNLGDLATLHHQQDQTLDIVKARAALGLAETADEAAVLAAISANAGMAQTHSAAISTLVLNAAGAAGVVADTADKLITALAAKTATSVSPDTLVQLQTQLNELKCQRAKDAATRYIDGAIAAGKPIVATRDQLIVLHATDPAMIEKMVNAMPSLKDGGIHLAAAQKAAGEDGDELSDDEKDTAGKAGVSHEDMKAEKKRQKEKRK